MPDQLRRRCQDTIKTLPIPRPWDLESFRGALECQRGRPLQLSATDAVPGGPCGLWIATRGGDYIFYERGTTPTHRLHIILHEIGHLLFAHQGSRQAGAEDLARMLLPDLSLDLLRRVLGRSAYTDIEEQEAETFASVFFDHLTAPVPTPPLSPEEVELLSRVDGAFGGVRRGV